MGDTEESDYVAHGDTEELYILCGDTGVGLRGPSLFATTFLWRLSRAC